MIQISRRFQDLTRSSPELQYRRDVFSAGLMENPCVLCDFAQCRKLCEEHERKWSNAGRVVDTIREVPEGLIFREHSTTIINDTLVAFLSRGANNLGFFRVPPVTSRKPIEGWKIPPFPFDIKAFAVYPPENILVVAEVTEQ